MWLKQNTPALLLAPMDSITDSPMRALQGEFGAFTLAVSEFIRVTDHAIPGKVFVREVPELLTGGKTVSGLPVQIQILGGNPQAMALSAQQAVSVGAHSIDINFGCPAPLVNRNDGGASILKTPCRIKEIVSAVRSSVPAHIPVSAKVRLGWSNPEEIFEIADMAVAGGANWLTVHARTKEQRYQPPVYWSLVGKIRDRCPVPVVANGDIWSLKDFRLCRAGTGCSHFMLGRGALANPGLAGAIAAELGIAQPASLTSTEWPVLLTRLYFHCRNQCEKRRENSLHRLKQWLRYAAKFGEFQDFERVKKAATARELITLCEAPGPAFCCSA